MRISTLKLVGACLSAALLAACGGYSLAPPALPAAQQLSSTNQIPAHSKVCLTTTCVYAGADGGPLVDGNALVFPGNTKGDIRPVQRFELAANTGVSGVAVDATRNIYFSEFCLPNVCDVRKNPPDWVSVYAAGASGNNVKPIQYIQGSHTGLCNLGTNGIAVDANLNIYVPTICYRVHVHHESVLVFGAGANGNVEPIRKIRGPKTRLASPRGIALDSAGNTYVLNATGVVVFAAGANGNVKPIQTITGSKTGLTNPSGIAVDPADNIYVTNLVKPNGSSVDVFAAGADGNVAPIRTIGGKVTGLDIALGCAVDAGGNVYVLNWESYYSLHHDILVFAAGANGDVAPIRKIRGPKTHLQLPLTRIAVR